MSLSRQSLEILHDILEIKINDLQVCDHDDVRELNRLRKCRQELMAEINGRNNRTTTRLFRTGSGLRTTSLRGRRRQPIV